MGKIIIGRREWYLRGLPLLLETVIQLTSGVKPEVVDKSNVGKLSTLPAVEAGLPGVVGYEIHLVEQGVSNEECT